MLLFIIILGFEALLIAGFAIFVNVVMPRINRNRIPRRGRKCKVLRPHPDGTLHAYEQ